MSAEAREFAFQLVLLVGVPLIAWITFLIAEKVRSLSVKKGEQFRLFGTTRIFFAVGGVLLIAWGAMNSSVRPIDYVALSAGVGALLLLYPLIANLRNLGVQWGLLATFAQSVLVVLAGALAIAGINYGQSIAWPSASAIQAYTSLITWPVLAFLAGVLFFPHLVRILGNVESLEGFGGKISLRRQEQIESAVSEQVEEEVDAGNAVEAIRRLTRGVRSQANRYSNIIQAWTVVSKIISELAVPVGGPDDLTRVRQNINLLRDKGLLGEQLAKELDDLFKERNRLKRRDAPIDANEHRSFLERAQRLAEQLAAFSGRLSSPSTPTSEVRH